MASHKNLLPSITLNSVLYSCECLQLSKEVENVPDLKMYFDGYASEKFVFYKLQVCQCYGTC